MARFKPKQDETLPLPDEDPTGRGGGFQIRKVSKKGATAFERACAGYQGLTVAEYRRQVLAAVGPTREAMKAMPTSTPEECAANLQLMKEWAAESRRQWLKIRERANGV